MSVERCRTDHAKMKGQKKNNPGISHYMYVHMCKHTLTYLFKCIKNIMVLVVGRRLNFPINAKFGYKSLQIFFFLTDLF